MKKPPRGTLSGHESGEGGIRTLETVARLRDFQSRSFGHSDTSPGLEQVGEQRRTDAAGFQSESLSAVASLPA